jgi:hypothetical protein
VDVVEIGAKRPNSSRATMLQQNDDGEIEVQTKRDEIANDVQVVRTLQFDQMMLMIHFGSCWLPNVYM